jgi:hypothetical protein
MPPAAAKRAREHRAVVQRVAALQVALDKSGVEFDADVGAFRHNGRVVRGLTRVLKRTMWPRYKFAEANDAAARRFRKRDPALRRARDGRARGTRVHTQIETLTNAGGAGALKRRRERLHPYTAKLLLAFKAWGWTPIVSELPLVDAANRIGTAADLLCSAPGGRLILVETKTGYYGTWERASGQMEGPLRGVLSDSPRSQALLQLLMTKRMVQLHGTRVDAAYVVRVDHDGVTPEKAFAALERRADVVAAYVGERTLRARARPRVA